MLPLVPWVALLGPLAVACPGVRAVTTAYHLSILHLAVWAGGLPCVTALLHDMDTALPGVSDGCPRVPAAAPWRGLLGRNRTTAFGDTALDIAVGSAPHRGGGIAVFAGCVCGGGRRLWFSLPAAAGACVCAQVCERGALQCRMGGGMVRGGLL